MTHVQRLGTHPSPSSTSKGDAIGDVEAPPSRAMIARVMRRVLLLLVLVMVAPAAAQGPGTIRIAVEFRQAADQSRDAVGGRGSVIITERGAGRPRAGVGADGVERRVRRSTGIFTLVQDGGESLLAVATQVPVQQIAFYRDYATGAGYLATGVVFLDVGTSLKVQASLVPGNQIR
jgi:hypothetical protein